MAGLRDRLPVVLHSRRRLAIPLLIAVLCWLTLPAGEAFAQVDRPLDHFRCYELLFGPPSDDVQVALQDQFDIALGLALPDDQVALGFFIGQPERFCNPVEKSVRRRDGTIETTPITDPNNHLTLYRIFPTLIHAVIEWRVRVSNQFGQQRLEAGIPRYVAVPTHKIEDDLGFPEDLDHFKCYEASGDRVRRRVRLEDQFEPELVTVLSPRLFCNPTRKLHTDGASVSIENAAAHLTCYDIELVQGDPPVSNISLADRVIANQFTGESTGDIRAVVFEDLLCVPTRKVAFAQKRPDDDDGRDDDDDDDDDDD